ncbi:MAG: hypothetical protein VW715_11895 [Rhodospirillales bacterium]
MPDPTAMLQEFGKYLDYVEIKGRKPSEEDVDNFIEKFLSNLSYGFSPEQGIYIQTAYKRMPDGSYLYPVSSYKEAVKEIKPILMARVLEAHGEVSEHYEPDNWEAKPMTVDEYAQFYAKELNQEDSYLKLKGTDRRNHKAYQKAVKHVLKIKYRINQYMRKVLPFILRNTMHHPLGVVTYSTTQGPNKNITKMTDTGDPIIINDEEDLTQYMNTDSMDGVPAALDSEIRSIFWAPTITGRGLKMGVININNPANLPMKVLLSSVKKIHKIMEYDMGHPTIIMFTGNSWQIWFGMNERESIANFREMQDYLKVTLYAVGAFDESSAIEELRPFLDLKTNAPNKMVRSFFSLHYPSTSKSDKDYTGLAAIPVAPVDLESFNPAKDAHPDAVLANFDIYSSYVAAFYDKVQIGQDYESEGEIESTPTCSRLDKQHKDAKALKAIYKSEDLIQVEYRNITAMLEDEKKVYAHPIARGVLAVLVYDPKGTSAPPGMVTQRSRRGRVVTETPKSYYILSNGTVIYDDYICRDLERICIANKVKQAILVGRVSMIDSYGNEEGENETRNALIRTEGISPIDARVMRFTINRASIVNSERVPIEVMNEQMQVFSSKRIIPSAYFEFTEPVGMKLKKKFMDLVRTRASGAMMVEGEEKYLIKSTRTINATIIGMDTSGKAYSSNEIPNVFIALAKPSGKYGAEYITVAKAQIALKKEDRITLRTLVEGQEQKNLIPAPRGIEGVIFTEPSVVVEISYDDVTPQRYPNLTMYFTSEGNFRATSTRRAVQRLINAKVINIKEDLDYRKPSHINIRQEELLDVSNTTSKTESILSVLPNPNQLLPPFIKRNPAFFGVPDSLTSYVGGVPDEKGYMVGGRRVEIPLLGKGPIYLGERLPAELEKSYDRYRKDEPGFKTFVDVNSLVRTVTPPNYRVTDLGWEYNTAQDDTFGLGQDGNAITKMDGALTPIKSYADVIDMVHFDTDKEQAMEDLKVIPYTSQVIAGDIESEDPTRRAYDKGYQAAYLLRDKKLNAALGPVRLGKEDQEALTEEILSNPPVKSDIWQSKVDVYTEEFNKWASLPEPKEGWENYAIGMFVTWEVPLLEKERLLRAAQEKYELTADEVDMIDSQYADAPTEELFDLILSDLYEVPDYDDEIEESSL